MQKFLFVSNGINIIDYGTSEIHALNITLCKLSKNCVTEENQKGYKE